MIDESKSKIRSRKTSALNNKKKRQRKNSKSISKKIKIKDKMTAENKLDESHLNIID